MFVCVCLCVGLWRSKEHRKLTFPENMLFMVLTHGGHGYECGSVSDHLQEGHMTSLYFRGQKNIET